MTSGGLRQKTILDLQGSPFVFSLLSSFIFISSFHGVFLTEARVPLKGRWFSRNFGCQDVAVPPQNTGVGFVFVVCCYLFFNIVLQTCFTPFAQDITFIKNVVFSLFSLCFYLSSSLSLHTENSIFFSFFSFLKKLKKINSRQKNKNKNKKCPGTRDQGCGALVPWTRVPI